MADSKDTEKRAEVRKLVATEVTFHTEDDIYMARSVDISDGVWRIAETTYDMDFTGTDFDSKAECQASGIRFSDDDVPFPDFIKYGVSGSWTMVSGSGWQPASSTNTGYYYCKATNLCGSDSTNTATLTVNEAPSITSQTLNTTICEK